MLYICYNILLFFLPFLVIFLMNCGASLVHDIWWGWIYWKAVASRGYLKVRGAIWVLMGIFCACIWLEGAAASFWWYFGHQRIWSSLGVQAAPATYFHLGRCCWLAGKSLCSPFPWSWLKPQILILIFLSVSPEMEVPCKELHMNGSNPMQPQRAFPSFAECMKSICHQSLSGGFCSFPKLKSLAWSWEHKGQSPGACQHRLPPPASPAAAGSLPGLQHHWGAEDAKNWCFWQIYGSWATPALCGHRLCVSTWFVLSESLCRGWAKEMGKWDCFGGRLNLLQWQWGKKKRGQKREWNPESGGQGGGGGSSHGVRAPLLLALGDLGSLLYFSPLRHIYIKLLWAECFLVLVSALFKHKCFEVHR